MKLCREKIRKAKAQLELNLATKVKENNKYFYKYINSKRRARENLHPLLDAKGNLVTKDQIRLRCLMPSLPQSLIVRLVTPWEHSPLCW